MNAEDSAKFSKNLSSIYLELVTVALQAKRSYTCWITLATEIGKPHIFNDVLAHYDSFFQITATAHIHLVFINLHQLFDKRKGTKNLNALCEFANCDPCVGQASKEKLNAIRVRISPLVKKLGILRGHYFGHKNIDLSLADTMKLSGIYAEDIPILITATFDILNLALGRLTISEEEVGAKVAKTTTELLGTLSHKLI